jgi:uncharacterized alkaline shock family protein YloU
MDRVLITDVALESLIVHACMSVDGIGSMWKGLKERLPFWDREGVQPHGVNIVRDGLDLTLDVYVTANFGTDLRRMAGTLRAAIVKEVEASTPYHVQEVNVHIADVCA